MTAYLGNLGMMVPLGLMSELSIQHTRNANFAETLGGRRVAQIAPRAHREWRVSPLAEAYAEELAPILGFIRGEFGNGPWWWLDEWAQVTNILPPDVSLYRHNWRNTTRGGPVTLPDGAIAGESLIANGSTYVDWASGDEVRFPVVQGVPVTGSAWLGGARHATRIEVRDVNDQVLDFSHVERTGAGLQRTAATITPGPNAHHCVLRFINPGRIVRPALTFTPQVTSYHGGNGCTQAIIQGTYAEDVIRAHVEGYADSQAASGSFTISEVG